MSTIEQDRAELEKLKAEMRSDFEQMDKGFAVVVQALDTMARSLEIGTEAYIDAKRAQTRLRARLAVYGIEVEFRDGFVESLRGGAGIDATPPAGEDQRRA